MRYVSLAVLLALGGCANPSDKFREAWPTLRGQPVGYLIERWGPATRVVAPDTAQAIHKNDGPVYVWNNSQSAVFESASTSTGTIGTTPFVITTTTPQAETYYCTVTVMATRDNRIKRIVQTGARGPCGQFSDRL